MAAGLIAQHILSARYGIEIVAWVDQVGTLRAQVNSETVQAEDVDQNDVRCPDLAAAEQMTEAIHAARKARDTIGGTVACVARNIPPGGANPSSTSSMRFWLKP